MNTPRQALMPAILLSAAVLACAPAESPPPEAAAPGVDTAAVMAGVADLWSRWAVADTADDLDGILALLNEDGRLDLKGFPPLLGREAARAAMGPLYAQVDYLEATATPSFTIAISSALAHQAGTYMERYTLEGQKGEMTDHGRYAAALAKGADGQWRWAYMMAMVDSTVTRK